MDENMNQIPEQEPETTDAFLDGWDGEAEAAADQPEVDAEPMETGEETPAEAPSESAETPEEDTQPPADAEQAAQTQQTEAETVDARPQTWELRHMGEVRQANEAEMVALAQKGMDYDRIKQRLDGYAEIKAKAQARAPYEELIKELADEQHMTPEEFMDASRAAMLARREGIDVSIAR